MHNQNIRPSDIAGDGSDAPRAEELAQQWSRAFPDLNAEGGELNQTNLILPEPCTFLHRSLPPCSIVRPTLDQLGGAVATIKSFTADRLFEGQSPKFFRTVLGLARDADDAERRAG